MKQQKRTKTEERSSEPHWLIKAFFTGFVGALGVALASGVLVTLGFLGAGFLRVASSDRGILVLIVLVAALTSVAMFVLGVRLCVYFFFRSVAAVWEAAKSFKEKHTKDGVFEIDFTQMKEEAEQRKASEAFDQSVSSPKKSTRVERVRGALMMAAFTVMAWLVVPRRFR